MAESHPNRDTKSITYVCLFGLKWVWKKLQKKKQFLLIKNSILVAFNFIFFHFIQFFQRLTNAAHMKHCKSREWFPKSEEYIELLNEICVRVRTQSHEHVVQSAEAKIEVRMENVKYFVCMMVSRVEWALGVRHAMNRCSRGLNGKEEDGLSIFLSAKSRLKLRIHYFALL